MAPRLRVACFGDSWIVDRTLGPNGLEDKTPLPDALRSVFEKRSRDVELIVAGFPGATSYQLLDLAQACKVRDMARLSQQRCSIKGNIWSTLEHFGIPFLEDEVGITGPREDIDVIAIIAGSNDLYQHFSGYDIVGQLYRLRRIFTRRGIEVVFLSLALAPSVKAEFPDFEREREYGNSRLLAEEGVVDYDELMIGFGPGLWQDECHLTEEGYKALGERLAVAISARFATCIPQTKSIQVAASNPARHFMSQVCLASQTTLQVISCYESFTSGLVTGSFVEQGENHGKPMYAKQGADGSATVLIFFWDARDGCEWAGWWFGPSLDFEHPGWARHLDFSSNKPPTSGWQVPPGGSIDDALRIYLTSEAVPTSLRTCTKRSLDPSFTKASKNSALRRRICRDSKYWQNKARKRKQLVSQRLKRKKTLTA
eukprot:TRINITY_DN74241_c0_g1_i1.p1 TRINITY_DN74241_c0_g1~~TRINITY_DN74241_c0_g1_i1.p1  ORF type:complete len:444 (-),score=38.69 TRINITY_DN74241_c0_g1_i1:237-1517(-)